jgi:sugar phosphate isomerase/epimerase
MRRRELLRLLGIAGAGSALPRTVRGWAGRGSELRHLERAAHRQRLGAIGIQLYTVRTLMARDVERTLAALAEIGYREVELAGLHGKSAKEMRAIIDRHHLVAPSSHISLDDIRHRWPQTLSDAAVLGQRFIVCPDIGAEERTAQGYRRVAGEFNTAAEAARRAGLQFCYHNHDFEFAPLAGAGGTLPYDILLAECEPALVAMELDLYWIVKGGRDPLAYFAKHPGRFPLVHVKDMARDGSMVDVGNGRIDFRAIFAQSKQAGIEHYFVEHDEPLAPLDDARTSYDYLRRLDF